ncbi:NAD-dependent epimerase/dehydratase family protein [Alphaproteobacteria bacterium]|nr:NAD-dependent epimerase/dehydratase family protein [Alphaproteobacteria bacterium]
MTGGRGFVGAKLIRKLLTNGHSVTFTSSRDLGDGALVIDLRYQLPSEEIMSKIDVVIHLAGLTADSENSCNWNDYFWANTVTTRRLAKLSARCGVSKFLFMSSVRAMPSEKELDNPSSGYCDLQEHVYGKTKFLAERELDLTRINSEMKVVILRPCVIYGPGCKGNLSLMYKLISKGIFPAIPDNGNKRSLIHVDDVIRGIIFFLDGNNFLGKPITLTDGLVYSSREIFNEMRAAAGLPIVKYSVPMWVFTMLSIISKRIEKQINRLFCDDFHGSKTASNMGFNSQKRLSDLNISDY